MSIEAAIDSFIAKTKQGLEYVCTCCHRVMYRECVLYFNRSKYSRASESVLDSVFNEALLYKSTDSLYYI